ncbi:hypothetical protein F2Q69_00059488 [Brassica cretica]|uniref:Uncharacterized protein n=1 Tax=Brassica cretica TaxID=69181 RepID=A0A8S9RBG2_BRACR|nr:hypothetical protein F2Q69_00059488 [Brassica cretica]
MCATGRPLTRRPHGCRGRGQPSTPSSRSPRATGVISLTVATADLRRLPLSYHGRSARVFLVVVMGDQFLASPGRHEAISSSFFWAGMERSAQRLRITRQSCSTSR